MKVAVINFSGNPGKSTLADNLLAPRMNAPKFEIETINAGATANADAERLKGKDYGGLQEDLMTLDSAIVDVGASNVEEFIKQMGQFDGSHEEFDYFVVPAISEKKQQIDTVNTIKTLSGLGVPAKKIRVVFNKVELEDANDVPRLFAMIFGFHEAEKRFTLRPEAVVFKNEIFERLRGLNKTVSEIVADETDYRAMLREATDEATKARAVSMISAQRLAKSAHKNLDDVYKVLFK
ncbi:StbB family protein [Burkholderia pseudomallei]|uniref:StbB family protein n=1 Tax=Burkholderia pseudomallei TaxID=28450 RepID=UPI000F072460|nr:StbB family protein [Burkholderia pseudomallei]CAJ3268547.1 putative plasmid stable inheritance protein [Burkholderia pseudomallei]CAJ3905979.1 putative plasmid stable inheritance protein [Burkholderia pseudomallei]CAJ5187204.1 putative plasmid stable inheritance protein [Burkholderia pseudomallei]CAJ5786685.1 putative plasmid stable inheritance protein [Burkholderia pseudomallei]CAJ6338699.1 putative plasmid stable inheritance protein [Burkholderia pseudomallei]